MIYDVLEGYRWFLGSFLRLETVRVYCNRLHALLEGQSITHTMQNFDISKVLDNLSNVKYKNEFSQCKNALLHFLNYQNISLNNDQLEHIKALERKTRKKYRKRKYVSFEKVDSTIKHLKNMKLKLSYQTLIATGLRVSELSQLTKSNCLLSEDKIFFSFIGKGGNKEKVTLERTENKIFFDRVREMIDLTEENEKIFYSATYLQKKAKEYGFQCHDLRRAYAKLEYKKTKSKEHVKECLRHMNLKTTEVYLKSRVDVKK